MKVVKILETLAKSRIEKPPMVTQAFKPLVFLKNVVDLLGHRHATRGCAAPSGSLVIIMA